MATADSGSNRLKEIRKAAGLTQKEVAARIGCSQTTISHIENGLVPLDTRWMRTFGKLLDCPPSDLLATEDNPDRLDQVERRFVLVYRTANDSERETLAKLIEAMSKD